MIGFCCVLPVSIQRFMKFVSFILINLLYVSYATAVVLVNPDFEISEVIEAQVPTTTGDWQFDTATIVSAENGITPFSGSQMLRFDTSSFAGIFTGSSGQVIQLTDLSTYSTAISAGTATVDISGYFNRVEGDAQTDTRLSVSILAYEGLVSDFPSKFGVSELDTVFGTVTTDPNTGTWELASASLLLPTNTDFIATQLSASEDIFNDTSLPEFDGHYADSISVSITIPEPSSNAVALGVFALGCVALITRAGRTRC